MHIIVMPPLGFDTFCCFFFIIIVVASLSLLHHYHLIPIPVHGLTPPSFVHKEGRLSPTGGCGSLCQSRDRRGAQAPDVRVVSVPSLRLSETM